jgi:hypothetical protein
MKKIALLLFPIVALPTIPSAAHACITSIICPSGQTNYALMRQQRENNQITQSVVPAQYYPAQMMMGGGGPVIVPPTVINTQQQEHNSSKKSCKESQIDLFLFSIRKTQGDCTS